MEESEKNALSTRFHHVGVVTGDPEEAVRFYRSLGYSAGEAVRDHVQKASIILLTRADGPVVELLTPAEEGGPLDGWIRRIQGGVYRTCYEVDGLDEAIPAFETNGMRLLSGPDPAVVFGGRRVAFLWSRAAGLIELLESG